MIIIGTSSPKGGDGATFVCANIAYMLSAEGKKCLCIDMNAEKRTLDLLFGTSDSFVFDLNDVCENNCTLNEATITNLFGLNLDFITSSQTRSFQETQYAKIFNVIKSQTIYDYVIIDLPNYMIDDIFDYIDMLLLVSSTSESSVRCLEKQAYNLKSCENVYVVANKIIPELISNNICVNIDDMCDRAGIKPIGIIPFEPEIIVYEKKGIPSGSSKILNSSKAMNNIKERILGNKVNALDFNYKSIHYKNIKKHLRQEAE
jgi:septum site-determining protein MinD